MRKLLPFLPLALVVGCNGAPAKPPDAPNAPAASAPRDGDALTADEKTVRAAILDGANDPKSVEFSRWGPDVTGDDLRALLSGAAAAHDDALKKLPGPAAEHPAPNKAAAMLDQAKTVSAVVRVRFRANNLHGAKQLGDALFMVDKSGNVSQLAADGGSDDWPKRLEERLAVVGQGTAFEPVKPDDHPPVPVTLPLPPLPLPADH